MPGMEIRRTGVLLVGLGVVAGLVGRGPMSRNWFIRSKKTEEVLMGSVVPRGVLSLVVTSPLFLAACTAPREREVARSSPGMPMAA